VPRVLFDSAVAAGVGAGVSGAGAGAVSAAAAGFAREELSMLLVKKLVLFGALGFVSLGVVGTTAWVGVPAIRAALTDDAKADKEKLQGEWKVTSATNGGQDTGKHVGDVVKFDGDKFIVPDGECEYKLDPSKKPKQIDVSPLEGKEKGMTFHGVYKLDGDKLTLHMSVDEQERPAGFEAKEGALLFVLERVKK
jgi:uncharacterized protein (TIGR03067 family)